MQKKYVFFILIFILFVISVLLGNITFKKGYQKKIDTDRFSSQNIVNLEKESVNPNLTPAFVESKKDYEVEIIGQTLKLIAVGTDIKFEYTIEDPKFNDKLLRIDNVYELLDGKYIVFFMNEASRDCNVDSQSECWEEFFKPRASFLKYGGLWRFDTNKKLFEQLNHINNSATERDSIIVNNIDFNPETLLFSFKYTVNNQNKHDVIVQIIDPTLTAKNSVIEELLNTTPEEYEASKE